MKKTKNRGALSNPEGRFEKTQHEVYDDGWDLPEEESASFLDTTLFVEKAKSIITTNDSPDIGFEQSINPYRGCEHGCIYCYARPAHAYVNLSAGIDFETKIFYKENAAHLLEKELNKANYQCKTIMLGSNTDPYQPAEAKLKITRSLLEVMDQYHHPVTIITKGTLIERDLDILVRLAERQLVKVAVSITTLSLPLKTILEPRTGAPKARLRLVRRLVENRIPVRIMAAPIIPLINDKELEHILAASKEAGAHYANYILVRLPHEVKDLFKEWLNNHFPERAQHVMSIIRQMRGGKEYDATFNKRMRGEGEFAALLAKRFHLACKRLGLNIIPSQPLNTKLFKPKTFSAKNQLSLF